MTLKIPALVGANFDMAQLWRGFGYHSDYNF